MLGVQLFGQSSFSDDFSDGDFSSNPSWAGQTTLFQINTTNQLQLDDVVSNTSSLVTTSTAINSSTWEFYVKLDFAPSTSNFARVYLVSDQQDLTQALNGYFVQIGGQTGIVDDVSLFRQDGTSITKIIDGVDGTVASSPEVRIRVTKKATDQWELFLDQTATGSTFTSQGVVLDNTYNSSSFFGIFCRYTSTRADKFFFDDFNVSGAAFRDTVPPSLIAVEVTSNNSLELTFNEKLDVAAALSNTTYVIDKNIGNPGSVQFNVSDSLKVQLDFSTTFTNGETYDLVTTGIADTAGNVLLNDTSSFTYFVPVVANYRDIVINEIYPDFNPSNGLPEAEFVELFNASSELFQLNGWQFADGSDTSTLTNYLIQPGEYLILCSIADTALFSPFGKTLGISRFPGLNNTGDSLQLFDSTGISIDHVNYTDDWYRDAEKKNGGYTLEQINPFTTSCIGSTNFIASNNVIGGTPGAQNSVYDTLPDTIPPSFLNASILAPDSILLTFDELLDTNSLSLGNYFLTPTISIDTAISLAPDYNTVIVTLQTPLDSGIIYSISVLDITDCAGNAIDDENQLFIVLPDNADSNDVVINEVLFNPRTGGVDFVELFNRSEKVIGLQNWLIANEVEDTIANRENISPEQLILLPKTYLVLTENKENILEEYPQGIADNIFEINDLPSYNDNEGGVYLFNSTNQLIDIVRYTDDQHFALLREDDGVSLERISAERPSNDPSNFHSASEIVGFATPGYENSQAFESIRFSGKISIEPEIFSPDNDGFQDVLNINYQFSAPGFVASVSIFDRNGRLIKRLVENKLLGSSGTFSWDGITDDNLKARIGVYVVLIEAFNVNGNQEVFKEVITVAGNLN